MSVVHGISLDNLNQPDSNEQDNKEVISNDNIINKLISETHDIQNKADENNVFLNNTYYKINNIITNFNRLGIRPVFTKELFIFSVESKYVTRIDNITQQIDYMPFYSLICTDIQEFNNYKLSSKYITDRINSDSKIICECALNIIRHRDIIKNCIEYTNQYSNHLISNGINLSAKDRYTLGVVYNRLVNMIKYKKIEKINIRINYYDNANINRFHCDFCINSSQIISNYLMIQLYNVKNKLNKLNIVNDFNVKQTNKIQITDVDTEKLRKEIKEHINKINIKLTDTSDTISLTEEATKNWFIVPLIQALGYDITSSDVIPEYTSDVGTKRGEKVDYALQINNKPVIFIECKKLSCELTSEYINQLYRYYTTSDVKVGILTNGKIYKFFTDSKKQNIMDLEPYFEFDITNIKDSDIDELVKYSKEYMEV